MRSWCTIGAAVGALALGASAANAESLASRHSGFAESSWLWELPSIGRLGPIGTSNSLFSVALHGGTAPSGGGATSSGKGAKAAKDDDKGHGNTYALIGGGAAIGLGVFIAAISGGSSDALTSTNTNSDTPFTPDTPGGTPSGGTPGAGDPGPITGDNTNPSVDSGPVTVTPEPASMALLASGLAGMGGIQFRRNRKRTAAK